jgi:hypothetical protein
MPLKGTLSVALAHIRLATRTMAARPSRGSVDRSGPRLDHSVALVPPPRVDRYRHVDAPAGKIRRDREWPELAEAV